MYITIELNSTTTGKTGIKKFGIIFSLTSCWMQIAAMYYAVLIPVALVLFANTVVFVMVVYHLVGARRRSKKLQSHLPEQKTALLHVKAGIAVFVVLGKDMSRQFGVNLRARCSINFRYPKILGCVLITESNLIYDCPCFQISLCQTCSITS